MYLYRQSLNFRSYINRIGKKAVLWAMPQAKSAMRGKGNFVLQIAQRAAHEGRTVNAFFQSLGGINYDRPAFCFPLPAQRGRRPSTLRLLKCSMLLPIPVFGSVLRFSAHNDSSSSSHCRQTTGKKCSTLAGAD